MLHSKHHANLAQGKYFDFSQVPSLAPFRYHILTGTMTYSTRLHDSQVVYVTTSHISWLREQDDVAENEMAWRRTEQENWEWYSIVGTTQHNTVGDNERGWQYNDIVGMRQEGNVS